MSELHRLVSGSWLHEAYGHRRPTERQNYINALILNGMVIGEPQVLRSGAPSHIFFNHARLLTEPGAARCLTDALAGYLKLFFPLGTLLANTESKSGGHLVGSVSEKAGMRQAIVVPESTAAAEGTMGRQVWLPESVSGRYPEDIVVVDSVATSGGTTVPQAVAAIRQELSDKFPHTEPPHAHLVVALARQPAAAREALAGHDIRLHYLATGQEVLAAAWSAMEPAQQQLAAQEFPGLPSPV